jgi:hypothetical protein
VSTLAFSVFLVQRGASRGAMQSRCFESTIPASSPEDQKARYIGFYLLVFKSRSAVQISRDIQKMKKKNWQLSIEVL